MPLPTATYVAAHGVVTLPQPLPRDAGLDEAFIQAVKADFPNITARQILPSEAPPGTPHLLLATTSSQVAISLVQSDFEVRFFGDYQTDPERCFEYVERKMSAVLKGWQAAGAEPTGAGMIFTLHISLQGQADTQAVPHLLSTHLRPGLNPSDVNDARTQVGLRVADHYFVNLSVSNYEIKYVQRPILAGTGMSIVVPPWEGNVTDVGIEVVVDINDRLRAIHQRSFSPIANEDLSRLLALTKQVATDAVPGYVETGELDMSALQAATTS